MAADLLPATLSFLTDAAHLLMAASPEASSHIMLQRNRLMSTSDLGLSDVQRQHVCGGCGHIMVPGQGDLLKMESNTTNQKMKKRSSAMRRKPAKKSSRSGYQKTLTCGKCSRYTKINIPPPAHISKRRSKPTSRPVTTTVGAAHVISRSTSVPMVASSEPVKLSASASSKKRTKNRKQGLQALLSSSSRPQTGLGLSLADFMQN
jgi:hypothetical protein